MSTKKLALRIIGGKWRRRKITLPLQKSVRPTKDFSRETLFNWLAPMIVDSVCLDLFSGSGILSFEALSRGAQRVVMVDGNYGVIKRAQENALILQTDSIVFHCGKIPEILSKLEVTAFDLVFLDPPFYQNLLQHTCEQLVAYKYVKKGTYIYIESEKKLDIAAIVPDNWEIIRQNKSGSVKSSLLLVQ